MTLKVYNSLSGEKEIFKTLEDNKVKIYSCGPTVYDYFHIGNARAFMVPDVIKRYLIYKGYDVLHVMNFTDIDDKMINRANEEGISVQELADRFIDAFFEDIERLNIKKADIYPKATDHISDMIGMINGLIEDGFAYENNGDVYFRVAKFSRYGKLSKKNLDDLVAGARVEVNDKKENPLDFVLWKASKEGEPSWDSPWGAGRPGWHIECSAMSKKYLGEEFDIHTGGVDLTFPHHENEIAQSEACCDHKVVNYWLHNGYINIDGEKMSKSLGNFFTTREILNKYPAEVVRFFLISNHYRSPINFSDRTLYEAGKSRERITSTVSSLNQKLNQKSIDLDEQNKNLLEVEEKFIKQINGVCQQKKNKFINAMDDDFNTALAIGALHELATEINKIINRSDFLITDKIKNKALDKAKSLFIELGDVLGSDLNKHIGIRSSKFEIDKIEFKEEVKEVKEVIKEIKLGLYRIMDNLNIEIINKEEYEGEELINILLDERKRARQNKNYQLADEIRDRLDELGIEVKDTPQGAEWSLK